MSDLKIKKLFNPNFILFITCLAAALAINLIGSHCNADFASTARHKVFCKRVVDGDTIIIKSGNKKIRVRLLGIDTPEVNWKNKALSQKGASEATLFLKNEIEGKVIFIESEEPFVGYYGRVLGYIFKEDGTFINASIVEQGYGRVFRRYPCKRTDELLTLEKKAKSRGLGIWKVEK